MVKGCEMQACEKKEKTGKVSRIRTRPVVTVAMEAGLAIRNQVHEYRNPASGP